jgi:hypothetical protein
MNLFLVLQLILLFAVVAVAAVVLGGGDDERASGRSPQYPTEDSSASPRRPA